MRSSALLLLAAVTLTGCATPDAPPAAPAAGFAPVAELRVAGQQHRGASIAAAGNHVVATWTASTDNRTDVYAAVSRDGGATFSEPARVNATVGDARYSGEQAPRVAIGDDVVVVWQSTLGGRPAIRFARSQDGGLSFGPTASVHDEARNGPRGWASLATDRGGQPLVVWLDTNPDTSIRPQAAPSGHSAGHTHGHMTASQNTVFARLAADSRPVTSVVATAVCFCCKTAVAAGVDGTIYAAWRHIYEPNLRDIAVARSSDDGRSFSTPVRVSQDGWAIDGCPEDGPSLAVDAADVLHVTWPSLAPAASDRKAIFYTSSEDGGKTFAPRVRLDEAAADRRPAHPRLTTSGSQVFVTWDEDRGTQRAIVVKAIGGARMTVDVPAAASYPGIAATSAHVLLAWTATGPESALHIARAPR